MRRWWLILTVVLVGCTPLPIRFGFSPGHPIMSDPSPGTELDQMRSLGAKWVRLDIDWSHVQAGGPNSWNWTAVDRVVRAARARGLEVLGLLTYAPAWSPREPGCTGDKCGPTDPAPFVRFAREAVRRYGPSSGHPGLRDSIRQWEIWNEANIPHFWRPAPNPARYAALLRETYRAIKAEDPDALVLSSGTAPAPDDGTSISPPTWVRALFRHGAEFDHLAHHPYAFPFHPSVWEPWNAFRQTSELWRIAAEHGRPEVKVWATEIGARVGPLTEPQQRGWYRWARDAWDTEYGLFTGPFFWFQVRDTAHEPGFGVNRPNGTERPVAEAMRNHTRSGQWVMHLPARAAWSERHGLLVLADGRVRRLDTGQALTGNVLRFTPTTGVSGLRPDGTLTDRPGEIPDPHRVVAMAWNRQRDRVGLLTHDCRLYRVTRTGRIWESRPHRGSCVALWWDRSGWLVLREDGALANGAGTTVRSPYQAVSAPAVGVARDPDGRIVVADAWGGLHGVPVQATSWGPQVRATGLVWTPLGPLVTR